uniref:Tc1-like transposase DDE domain-containing protein n=1 Tax=Sinocyclocheilus rhinocerous TaxID=307959 RepID=A0A673KXK7_9TELE
MKIFCKFPTHDNDAKHTTKKVGDFLKQKSIKVLNWPPQSPDLNPNEHLWEVMERRRLDDVPKNQQELKNLLQRVCENIEVQVYMNLVDSMPRRLQAVIEAKAMLTLVRFRFKTVF